MKFFAFNAIALAALAFLYVDSTAVPQTQAPERAIEASDRQPVEHLRAADIETLIRRLAAFAERLERAAGSLEALSATDSTPAPVPAKTEPIEEMPVAKPTDSEWKEKEGAVLEEYVASMKSTVSASQAIAGSEFSDTASQAGQTEPEFDAAVPTTARSVASDVAPEVVVEGEFMTPHERRGALLSLAQEMEQRYLTSE